MTASGIASSSPSVTNEARCSALAARALGDAKPKYLNSPDSAAYHKSAAIFGIDLARTAIAAKHAAVIVEGYFDVIAAHAAGVEHTVASSGTALTREQVHSLGPDRGDAHPLLRRRRGRTGCGNPSRGRHRRRGHPGADLPASGGIQGPRRAGPQRSCRVRPGDRGITRRRGRCCSTPRCGAARVAASTRGVRRRNERCRCWRGSRRRPHASSISSRRPGAWTSRRGR